MSRALGHLKVVVLRTLLGDTALQGHASTQDSPDKRRSIRTRREIPSSLFQVCVCEAGLKLGVLLPSPPNATTLVSATISSC